MILGGLVALRKESVDRNCPTCQWRRSVKLVALRKESVDRNAGVLAVVVVAVGVALRKESVDRNFIGGGLVDGQAGRSPQGERG